MMGLYEKSIGVVICTPCTLNCRLCCLSVPAFREKKIAYFCDVERYKKDMAEAFNIYDHVETVSLTGGEPLLNKQLADIVAFSLCELPSKFDQLRITTNGTMIPNESLLKAIRSYAKDNILFVIDDYGELSKKVSSIIAVLKENHIPYRINRYWGKDQHCGGWTDLGPLDQFRGYSSEEVRHIEAHCHFGQWKCLIISEGKLFPCSRAFSGTVLGYFSLPADEYVDLAGTQTLDEKKRVAAMFGKKENLACQYCNGFDPETAPRFPAGEQISWSSI